MRVRRDPQPGGWTRRCSCTAVIASTASARRGSAFVINALIEAARVEVLSGAPARFEMPTESGRPHGIYRCPTCGDGDLERVRAASDIDPLPARRARSTIRGRSRRRVHIYTRSKQPWVHAAARRCPRSGRTTTRSKLLAAREPRPPHRRSSAKRLRHAPAALAIHAVAHSRRRRRSRPGDRRAAAAPASARGAAASPRARSTARRPSSRQRRTASTVSGPRPRV